MLSKKMAFSLTSLITILALAFVMVPAMAADDFDATFSVTRVSTVSDHNAAYGMDIPVTLTFGAQVDGTAATLTIFVEDKFGQQTSVTAPEITKKDLNTVRAGLQNDNKVFIFTIPASATDMDDVKVHIHVAAGVAEIVPLGSEKTSKEGTLTIDLVGTDMDDPQVISIALVPGVIIPAAGFKGDTIDIIITLSEAPKAFTVEDHLDVTEATASDLAALDPVAEQTANELQARFQSAGIGDPPRTRMIYDETVPTGTTLDYPTGADQADVAAMYGGIHRAIAEADAGTYTYAILSPATGEALADGTFSTADVAPDQADTTDPKVAAAVGLAATMATDTGDLAKPTEPSKTLTMSERHPGTVTDAEVISYPALTSTETDEVTFPAGTDRTVKPRQPQPWHFATDEAYNAGLVLFNARRSLYVKYMNEKAVYDAYINAVSIEQGMDEGARDMYYSEQFGMEVPRGTGYDSMLHPYLVTITPKYENKNAVVVKVKEWEEQVIPAPGRSARKYSPPVTEAGYTEGVDKLTIKIGQELLPDKTAGIEVNLLNEGIIPEDGYLVVAKSKADSAVRDPGDAKKSPEATARQPFALTYNLIEGGLPNLESLLLNGGTIDLVSPDAGLTISEIMWGTDASIADSFKSQYIEIRNTSGAEIKMGDKTHKLIFYPAGATLPAMSVAANNIQDRVATVGSHGHWSILGKGESGRTGLGEAPGDVVAITPTKALVSMQRAADAASATGLATDGTDPMSWGASSPPGLNFDPGKEGQRIGSPGRAPVAYPTAPTPDPEPVMVPVAEADDIVITEIMVDTGGDRLPQWIELANVSGAEVSLAGWSVEITNADADTDVVGDSLSIDLSGNMLGISEHPGNAGKGKTLLLVGGTARSSNNLSGNDRVVDISSDLDETGRYAFISSMGFMIRLLPPQETGVLTYGDTVGNLDAAEAWEIPMSEGARSSLIRREMDKADMATMGTAANGWVLASSTALVSGPTTWYGSDEDAGTPGYDNGGPLPVELSMFYPARDKVTGAVVIKWETQSELNNAGFFIKRSQQRSTNFKVINATMIPGAGTTSEKQSYTYTDTTAQPNVVYYYQIEDVSLDGNRQQLTRGIRLRGHIGAAGKLTTTWGELKERQ